MILRLLLARHGHTAWNEVGRVQGQSDTSLSARGEQQAVRLGMRLAQTSVDAVYASDLERAWRTAELAAWPRTLPVERNRVWRELSFGTWEGRTWSEVFELDKDLAARRMADPAGVAPPGGEHLLDLDRRLGPAIDSLCERHPGGTVLVVTHGGVLRGLGCRFLGVPFERAWRFQNANCGLSSVALYDAGPILEYWNDTSHLVDMGMGT